MPPSTPTLMVVNGEADRLPLMTIRLTSLATFLWPLSDELPLEFNSSSHSS